MIAVGIDVSKSKSTVAILDSYGTVLATPFNMAHTQPEMNALVSRLKAFDEPVTILLEYTGHYHYPVLKKLQDEGLPVCVVNPYQMKKYGDVEIHKAKQTRRMLSVLQRMLWRNPTDLFPIVPWSKNTKTSNFYPDSISKESRWSQDSRSSLSIFWIRPCPESQKFLR